MGISRYHAGCFADSTKPAYRSQRKCYLDFCLKMGYPPVPAPPGNLCRYAVYLSDYRQLSASSIPKYLNVARLMHLECNLPNPLCDNWHLSSVLRGIKRCKGEPAHKKLSITPAILLQIHALLNFDSPLHIVFWAACLTLFFGLFRKSNVLAPTGAFNPEKYLCRRDILLHPWGLEILARWTVSSLHLCRNQVGYFVFTFTLKPRQQWRWGQCWYCRPDVGPIFALLSGK